MGPGGHPPSARPTGLPATFHLPVRGDAHADDPASDDAGPARTGLVGGFHGSAAARSRGSAQRVARLSLRLQARAVQLPLPARLATSERRADHGTDLAAYEQRDSDRRR